MSVPLRDELAARGFLHQFTSEDIFAKFDAGGQKFYAGFDPTADSLHLGNFCVFMQAMNYMKKGNKRYLLVGGATGMIGDPGGKNAERTFLTPEMLEHNVQSILTQVTSMIQHLVELGGLTFKPGMEPEVINNADFYKGMGVLDFLREVGKHITVNSMMNKETVKKRIEDPEQSISYTEFSYMLLQAYDFLRLYEDKGVTLQISGADQRGNVVTGIELVRKKLDTEVYGVTWPLILDSTGKKFGKSEGNAIRLDPKKSSPYFVYQYFMNTPDEDVERYLKLFTLMDMKQIDHIVSEHRKNPNERNGQMILAIYIVQTIFWVTAMQQANKISIILFRDHSFESTISDLSNEDKLALQQETGGVNITWKTRLIDLCVSSGLAESNGEAKKLIQSNSISINGTIASDLLHEVQATDAINGIIMLRKGKKTRKTILIW